MATDEKTTQSAAQAAAYRALPAVDALLRDPSLLAPAEEYGSAAVLDAARAVLTEARRAIASGGAPVRGLWPAQVAARLERFSRRSLRPVINATGVIIHTNLGRAPLSEDALAAMADVSRGYSNLEYDLAQGERGSRHDHARTLLQRLTGAEDALVVNNNAAAIYLVLAAFCQGRAVLISRSQLVEIGGGFRIPDVLVQGGARLVEVGTTNRTHARDFAQALSGETAAILRVHSSNFRQMGYVTMPSLAELADIAHGRPDSPLLLIDDLGSGSLLDTRAYGLAPEPMVQESVAAGADLVTFSGDKLLGGPQAGIITGRATLIESLRRHPLARALRVDKSTLAALEATLRAYDRGRAVEELPVWRMIAATPKVILVRVAEWQQILAVQGIAATVIAGESAIGGGSLPGETLPTHLLAIPTPQPDGLAAALRAQQPPVICRIQKGQLLFDPRTVLPEQEMTLLAAIHTLLKPGQS